MHERSHSCSTHKVFSVSSNTRTYLWPSSFLNHKYLIILFFLSHVIVYLACWWKSCNILLYFLIFENYCCYSWTERHCDPCWYWSDACILRNSHFQAATLILLYILPHVIIIILKSHCNFLCSVCVQKIYLHSYPE